MIPQVWEICRHTALGRGIRSEREHHDLWVMIRGEGVDKVCWEGKVPGHKDVKNILAVAPVTRKVGVAIRCFDRQNLFTCSSRQRA